MPLTVVTWAILLFGAVTLAPLVLAQLVMLLKPHSRQAREILVGKGEEWRDQTHFRSARGMAWADWLVLVPLAVAGSVGVIMGLAWGYVLWAAAGAISLYINIVLWFTEKDCVYPSRGPLVYFSYYWGFFVYWGVLALAYSALRLGGLEF